MPFNPKWVIGRTIVAVEMNPFDPGEGFPGKAYDPTFILDNGGKIVFTAHEVEDDSSIYPSYIPPPRRRRTR